MFSRDEVIEFGGRRAGRAGGREGGIQGEVKAKVRRKHFILFYFLKKENECDYE